MKTHGPPIEVPVMCAHLRDPEAGHVPIAIISGEVWCKVCHPEIRLKRRALIDIGGALGGLKSR